jgi:hypothetical protein
MQEVSAFVICKMEIMLKIIWKIVSYLNEHGGFSEYNITDMLLTTIRKSRVYPIVILKSYASDVYNNAIHTNISVIKDNSMERTKTTITVQCILCR